MSINSIVIILIIVGAAIALLSSLADLLRHGNLVAVDWEQLLLVVVGTYISVIGFWLL